MVSLPPVWLLNGPNLNLLGTREPERYGHASLQDIVAALSDRAETLGLPFDARQSNHEGELIDWLHAAPREKVGAVILNAGGYTHSSIALRDAVAAIPTPVIELHLTNIHARERFRRRSLLAPVAVGSIQGFGAHGYTLALDAAHRIVLDARTRSDA